MKLKWQKSERILVSLAKKDKKRDSDYKIVAQTMILRLFFDKNTLVF